MKNTLLICLAFFSTKTLYAQGHSAQIEAVADSLVDQKPFPLNLLTEVASCIDYPAKAKNKAIEGMVIVQVLIGKDGRPIRYIIKDSPDPLLTEAVKKCIHRLRCSPGLLDNKPVNVWVTMPFNFKLK